MRVTSKKLLMITIAIYIMCIVMWDDGQNHFSAIARLLVFGAAIMYFCKRGFPKSRYLLQTGLFLVYGWCSYVWAMNQHNTFENALTITYIFIIDNVIIAFLLKNKEDFISFSKVMFWAAILKALSVFAKNGFLAYVSARQGEGLVNANSVGLASATAFCFGLIILESLGRSNKKTLYKIGMLIHVLIIVLTASRKAILVLSIPIIIYLVLKEKNPLKTIRNIMVVMAIGIFGLYLMLHVEFLYNLGGNRIESLINYMFFNGATDGSTSFRMHLIEWGIGWFKQRPVFGYGLMNYKALLGTMGTWAGVEGTYAHNNYVELLVDVGLVGTLIYYFPYLSIIKKGIQTARERNFTRLIMLGLLVSILISEYGLVTYYDKYTQVTIVLIWYAIFNELPEQLERRAQ